MRASILALLFMPLVALADEVRVAIGQSWDEVVAIVTKHSATDITPRMEVVGPKGEHPFTGIYWEFRDYDAIIELTTKDGKVVRIMYWTKKDFGESKRHRGKSVQSVTALNLDTNTRRVSSEKKAG